MFSVGMWRSAARGRATGAAARSARTGHRGLAGVHRKDSRLESRAPFLPHFGLIDGDIAAHLDALEQRIILWSTWFRNRIRAGVDDAQMVPAFAEFVAKELRAGGGTESELVDYEQADPSFMAVSAMIRYWRKHHPEEVARSV
jgi:hypothetical protein